MDLFVINTGNLKLDGGAMFGIIPKILWNKVYPSDEENRINLSMRCLLIVEKEKKILIDTGIGDKHQEKFTQMYQLNGTNSLEKSLAAAGFSPADITDVINTHLHFDHCGGNTKLDPSSQNLTPTFPHAHYWVSKRQWESANDPNRREKPSFLKNNFSPVEAAGQLRFLEEDTFKNYGIKIRFSDGHTTGQSIPVIRYKGKKLVYCGDLIPTSAHVPLPYIMGYDIHPLLILDEKFDLLKEAADMSYILYFEHDLNIECCSVEITERGFKVSKVFQLSEVL